MGKCLIWDTEGNIKIKSPICQRVIAVSFWNKKIRTERIAIGSFIICLLFIAGW